MIDCPTLLHQFLKDTDATDQHLTVNALVQHQLATEQPIYDAFKLISVAQLPR
jgi:hypothetical protein